MAWRYSPRETGVTQNEAAHETGATSRACVRAKAGRPKHASLSQAITDHDDTYSRNSTEPYISRHVRRKALLASSYGAFAAARLSSTTVSAFTLNDPLIETRRKWNAHSGFRCLWLPTRKTGSCATLTEETDGCLRAGWDVSLHAAERRSSFVRRIRARRHC